MQLFCCCKYYVQFEGTISPFFCPCFRSVCYHPSALPHAHGESNTGRCAVLVVVFFSTFSDSVNIQTILL